MVHGREERILRALARFLERIKKSWKVDYEHSSGNWGYNVHGWPSVWNYVPQNYLLFQLRFLIDVGAWWAWHKDSFCLAKFNHKAPENYHSSVSWFGLSLMRFPNRNFPGHLTDWDRPVTDQRAAWVAGKRGNIKHQKERYVTKRYEADLLQTLVNDIRPTCRCNFHQVELWFCVKSFAILAMFWKIINNK